jgi:hypothetical protein
LNFEASLAGLPPGEGGPIHRKRGFSPRPPRSPQPPSRPHLGAACRTLMASWSRGEPDLESESTGASGCQTVSDGHSGRGSRLRPGHERAYPGLRATVPGRRLLRVPIRRAHRRPSAGSESLRAAALKPEFKLAKNTGRLVRSPGARRAIRALTPPFQHIPGCGPVCGGRVRGAPWEMACISFSTTKLGDSESGARRRCSAPH